MFCYEKKLSRLTWPLREKIRDGRTAYQIAGRAAGGPRMRALRWADCVVIA